ncbi:MAG: hypothetical protein JXA11_17280 [Phycisphaerae bacterium]|nr:hypothetical protein [Phycisphaerae bacterium]
MLMTMEQTYIMLKMMQMLLILLPILIFTLVLLYCVLHALIRYLIWRAARRRAQQEAYRDSHDAQGRPLPPYSRGICQTCGQFSHRVYYMPDGSRVCDGCYHSTQPPVKTAEQPCESN